jgi:hypothetical protein
VHHIGTVFVAVLRHMCLLIAVLPGTLLVAVLRRIDKIQPDQYAVS